MTRRPTADESNRVAMASAMPHRRPGGSHQQAALEWGEGAAIHPSSRRELHDELAPCRMPGLGWMGS